MCVITGTLSMFVSDPGTPGSPDPSKKQVSLTPNTTCTMFYLLL